MKDENIMLTVIMPTYNHEKYIAQAIESVVAQKTGFKIELLIGEDCSTDGTRKIVRQYAKKYPLIIRPVYYKHNVGAMKNVYCLYGKARGKYIASCEGDDFWCDENRAKRDVLFLENNPNYVAVCNRCKIVDIDSKEITEEIEDRFKFWEFDKPIFSLQDFAEWKLPGHCSAMTSRNIYKDKNLDFRIVYQASGRAGDHTSILLRLLYGDIYCGRRKVSCYRYRVAETENNFMSVFQTQNLRDEDFLMIRRLEHWAWKQKGIQIDLSKIKKNRLVGSVVVWMKNPTFQNFQVLLRIVKYSGKPIKYIGYALKVCGLKLYYWNICKIDKRVSI